MPKSRVQVTKGAKKGNGSFRRRLPVSLSGPGGTRWDPHQDTDLAVGFGLVLLERRAQHAQGRELPVLDGDGLAVQASERRF